MYSKKSVGTRMEPWRTPALTGYSLTGYKTCHPEPLEAFYHSEKKQGQTSDQKFHKTYVCKEDRHAKPCQKP